ncbi:MAG: hypothetical protein K2X76_11840 [Sphingomonas sp.]|nr:hypothetical protein [Sphingomonas sp.]
MSADETAEAVKRHARAIMRAAGSKLEHYESRSKAAILMAVMDAWEEAYRAGAARGAELANRDRGAA